MSAPIYASLWIRRALCNSLFFCGEWDQKFALPKKSPIVASRVLAFREIPFAIKSD